MLAFLLPATAVCGSLLIIIMRAIPLHRNHSIAHTHPRTSAPQRCTYTHPPPAVVVVSEASYHSPDCVTGPNGTTSSTYLHARNTLQQCQTPMEGLQRFSHLVKSRQPVVNVDGQSSGLPLATYVCVCVCVYALVCTCSTCGMQLD